MKMLMKNKRRAKFYKKEPFKIQVYLKHISMELSVTEDNEGCETDCSVHKTVFLAEILTCRSDTQMFILSFLRQFAECFNRKI